MICKRLGLGEKYLWTVKSGSGIEYHIWFKVRESERLKAQLNGPKSVYRLYLKDEGLCDHIELRWSQSQTVLPYSKHESGKRLEEFEKRDLGLYDFVALIIDGKYLSRDNIVIALGITITGVKIPLGFIQTTTENSKAVKGLLKNLIERNFHFEEGLLTVTDGSKGLKKAVEETFGEFTLTQRCQWHKRENVVSYLREEEKDIYRGKLQRAYDEPDYETAKRRLLGVRDELRKINRTALNSLEEGLEETLTMHRLGLVEILGRSFTTTNLIENLNSQLVKYIRKVKRWINSDMKSRWVAVALLEIEKKMRRINRYDKLHLLRTALKAELKLEQQKVA